MFTKLVIQANQLTKCHAVTTLHLPRLQLQYQNISDNSKACLIIHRTEKKMETLHDLTCHATVHRHMKTADVCHYANAKIPEFWSVSSDQHIRSVFGIPSGVTVVGHVILVNQNLQTVSFLTNRFIIAVLLLTYVRNSEKE